MIDPQGSVVGNGGDRKSDEEPFQELLSPTVRETLSEQEERFRALIQAHPLATVFGALALGFVAARALRAMVRG
jgi:hypothetical protein